MYGSGLGKNEFYAQVVSRDQREESSMGFLGIFLDGENLSIAFKKVWPRPGLIGRCQMQLLSNCLGLPRPVRQSVVRRSMHRDATGGHAAAAGVIARRRQKLTVRLPHAGEADRVPARGGYRVLELPARKARWVSSAVALIDGLENMNLYR
jgi:hypothetical protein